jgi:hypothetical protein
VEGDDGLVANTRGDSFMLSSAAGERRAVTHARLHTACALLQRARKHEGSRSSLCAASASVACCASARRTVGERSEIGDKLRRKDKAQGERVLSHRSG